MRRTLGGHWHLRPATYSAVAAVFLVSVLSAHQRLRSSADVIKVEAESLASSAQASAGSVRVQPMQSFGSGWSGGAQLFWGGAQPGGTLTLKLQFGASGRFRVWLLFTRAPDFANVAASIDGSPAASFTGFGPSVTPDRVLLGESVLSSGAHIVTLEIAGRSQGSRGFNVGLDRLDFEPADAPTPTPGAPTTMGTQGPQRPPSPSNPTNDPAIAAAPSGGPVVNPVTLSECIDQNTALRGQLIDTRSELARVTRELYKANQQIKEMTTLGGSQVLAYCASKTISRTTAGVETNCIGYLCEASSGMCKTSCTTTQNDCALGYYCDKGQCWSADHFK